MNVLVSAGAFLLLLMPLIIVHELGHYFAAKLVGVRVERFCIGLGRPIWSWRRRTGGTTWAIAPIPLGGYVMLRDSRNDVAAVASEAAHDLAFKSPWQRMFVSVAGPLANLLLAFLLLAGLFATGLPSPSTRLREPAPGSVADAAGLRAGDRIDRVGASPVRSWDDLQRAIAGEFAAGRAARLAVARSGGATVAVLGLRPAADLGELGLEQWRGPAAIVSVVPDGAFARAGGLPGDVIASVDGVATPDVQALAARIDGAAGQVLRLLVVRGGQRRTLQVGVVRDRDGGMVLGVELRNDVEMVTARYPFGTACLLGLERAWEILAIIAKAIVGLAAGTVSTATLAGPVGLAQEAGRIARLGAQHFIFLAAAISLNLGVVNLLPLGILDGGATVGALVEAIRGKPVSPRVAALARMASIVVLAALFGLATMSDFTRIT